jgi:hypothetical protein
MIRESNRVRVRDLPDNCLRIADSDEAIALNRDSTRVQQTAIGIDGDDGATDEDCYRVLVLVHRFLPHARCQLPHSDARVEISRLYPLMWKYVNVGILTGLVQQLVSITDPTLCRPLPSIAYPNNN